MVLDFDLHAEFINHGIVEVSSVVSDDPFKDVVPEYEVMLDESGYKVLSNWSK